MKPQDIKIGTVFYECQSGMNIKARATTDPVSSEGIDGRTYWQWKAVNVINDSEILYGLTEGLEHYGPRLYDSPQYISRNSSGKMVFKLLGGGEEEA